MDEATKARVLLMLEKAMAAYGKPLPEASLLDAWFDFLKPFSLQVIARAFIAHCDDSDFPPVPAVISRRCKQMDGRPTPDEAWAIAISGRDESETVVWTSEIAEAFSACRPVLETGDKIGARIAFKDTYTRIVTESRVLGHSVKWDVSLGHDSTKRFMALEKAKDAGLIPVETAKALRLTSDAPLSETECSQGKAMIRKLLTDLHHGEKRKRDGRDREKAMKRQAVAAKKKDIETRVKMYMTDVSDGRVTR